MTVQCKPVSISSISKKAIGGLYEGKREREEATHAISIAADRHASGIAAKSQQDPG